MRDEANSLAILAIMKQLKEIEVIENDYPEYNNLINLHKSILQTILPIEDVLIMGANKYIDSEGLNKIREIVLTTKRPISDFVNHDFLNEINLKEIIYNLTKCVQQKQEKTDALKKLLDAIELGEINVVEGVTAVANEDSEWFKKASDNYGIDEASLIYLFSKPAQPFYEELARIFEDKFKNKWRELFCPVCGRTSMIVKSNDKKRDITCMYCGMEYNIDQFVCQHCGNKDPNSLAFISFKDNKEYEIDYCEKCNHYIKIIYEDKAKRKIPRGLEDILTQHLDDFIIEQKPLLKRV